MMILDDDDNDDDDDDVIIINASNCLMMIQCAHDKGWMKDERKIKEGSKDEGRKDE